MVCQGRAGGQNRVFSDFSGHLCHFRWILAAGKRDYKSRLLGRMRTEKKLRNPLPDVRIHNSYKGFYERQDNKRFICSACCDYGLLYLNLDSVFFFT